LRLCKFDAMTNPRAGLIECAGRQFQHASRPAARQPDTPRLEVYDAVYHDPAAIERDHVNRKPHPAGVHAAAWHDPEPFSGFEPVTREETNRSRRPGVGHIDPIADHYTRVEIPCNQGQWGSPQKC
jgi:hypothetical protein